MPINNGREDREEFFEQSKITSDREVSLHSMEHPERSIDGIIFWSLTTIGKAIRNQAVMHKRGKRFQQATRLTIPSSVEEKARERNHGIAPPIGKPGIASNNRFVIGREAQRLICRSSGDCIWTGHNKLVGSHHQTSQFWIATS